MAMLELYHWEPNAASGRVLIALKEKGLEFQSRYLDVLAFEQFAPDFLALNPVGQAPVLVHDGEAFNEASFICEYLDETFPDHPLMPNAPLDRWAARAWQKYVDDYLAAAASDLAWAALGQSSLKARNWASLEQAVVGIPAKERRDQWQAALAGADEELLDKARERIRLTVAKMEADLDGRDWLAPGGFSLADIAVYPYANYLPRIAPELVNAETAPRTLVWLKRMSERPAVKAADAMSRTGDAYAVAAPGPEHVRWG
jgi:glutathione S-transferase/GST-like protein